jgi:hypothetical protein
MELSLDVGHRPCVIIRFNPDSYTHEDGKIVRSPWRESAKLGMLSIMKTHQNKWNDRIKNLYDCIEYWLNNRTDKTIEMIQLYY